LAIGRLDATDQHAAVGPAAAEGQVEALEAAAAVDTGGLVEVPPTALQLERVPVRERVAVTVAAVGELDLDEAVRAVADLQSRAGKQLAGDAVEQLGEFIASLQRCGPLEQGGPGAHRRFLLSVSRMDNLILPRRGDGSASFLTHAHQSRRSSRITATGEAPPASSLDKVPVRVPGCGCQSRGTPPQRSLDPVLGNASRR